MAAVAAEFAAREIELNMVHVRTKDSFARLDAKEIDLLCGGFASAAGAGDIPGDYEFLQWRREGLVLLTNLPQRELPVPAVSVDRLFSPMMELVTGTFARRGERTAFGTSHPLNLLWQAFTEEVAFGNPYAL